MISSLRLLLSICGIVACLADIAHAHAVLLETQPRIHGFIQGPETVFRLRFNSRIDAVRSTLNLVLPDGTTRALSMDQQSSPDTLTARSPEMKAGRYILRWQVLATDGHITRGEVPFQVR